MITIHPREGAPPAGARVRVPAGTRLLPLALLLAMTLIGVLALKAGYNPSHGAQGDFVRFHWVTVEQFRHMPWPVFMQRMETASGPLFYALLGSLPVEAGSGRALVLMLHLLSSLLLMALLRGRLSAGATAAVVLAFFVSPFQLGPALWGHPEALATLMALLALGWRDRQGGAPMARWLLPLGVAVRQTGVALVAVSVLDDLRRRRLVSAAATLALTGAVLLVLVRTWGGLTPPTFRDHLMPSTRTLLAVVTMLAFGLCAWDPVNRRGEPARWVARVLLLWPLLALAYNLTGPFERGGFLFSRLDALDAQRLPVSLASPLVMALALGWCWRSLRAQPWLVLQIAACAAVLASSNVLYVKYVDHLFWPLLVTRFVAEPADAASSARLRPAAGVQAALAWSGAHLLLVTLMYRA